MHGTDRKDWYALIPASPTSTDGVGARNESDLLSLSKDALGLLDTFAERRMTGCYSDETLATVEQGLLRVLR